MKNRRYRTLRRIAKIANVPEGCVAPKWFKYIYYILFPFNWFYEKQTGMHYDPVRNIYWIMDIKLSGDIFKFFNDASNTGELFRLAKTEKGIIIIEVEPWKHVDKL